jgi:hypothetical protein
MTFEDISPEAQELAAEFIPVNYQVSDDFVVRSIKNRAYAVLPVSLDREVFSSIVDETSRTVLDSRSDLGTTQQVNR